VSRKWVLDTETKGTGAQMVPLDKSPAGDGPRAPIVVREQPVPPPKPVEPMGPRRFKVVDVMSRQVLAEDVDLRTTVDTLRDARSIVDVNIYVWQDAADEWFQLSQGDRRRLWALRDRKPGGSAADD
jgi:hypothetical protein